MIPSRVAASKSFLLAAIMSFSRVIKPSAIILMISARSFGDSDASRLLPVRADGGETGNGNVLMKVKEIKIFFQKKTREINQSFTNFLLTKIR